MKKIDLHCHGIIGFHDFWLEKQIGSLRINLLELIVEECFKKNIDLCAITSQYEEGQIDDKETGLIHDRFGYLCREAERLPNEYNFLVDKEGILLVAEKKGKKVGILNSQSVGARLNGRRVDSIVIGTNRVPVGKPLDYTLDFAKERGFINIAEHFAALELFSLGESIKKYGYKYDAFEWNAQMIIPSFFKYVPVFGKLVRSACKSNNKKVLEEAKEMGKAVVAVSDAHRIEDIGIAYINIEEPPFALIPDVAHGLDSKKILNYLKEAIRRNKFTNYYGNQSFLGLFEWRNIYREGVKIYLGEENKPEGQRQEGDRRLKFKNLYIKDFITQ